MSDCNCCSEPVSFAATEGDCTGGLTTEVFDGLDKVGADVVLLHGGPRSCMPNQISSGLAGAGDISHRGFLG